MRQTRTAATKTAMISSKSLCGRPGVGLQKASMRNTSEAVIRTPAHNGKEGKRSEMAVAEPRSSAKSVLIMAISQRI